MEMERHKKYEDNNYPNIKYFHKQKIRDRNSNCVNP